MDVNEIVLSASQSAPNILPKSDAKSDTRLRSIEVDGLAVSEPDHMWPLFSACDARRDDVHVMSTSPRLASEEMNVLADSAKVRIVILGNERDSERPRKERRRHRRIDRGRKPNLPREVVTAQ